MAKYVIQMKPKAWEKRWEQYGKGYDTLEEAHAAFDALTDKNGFRIAEEIVVTRYIPLKKSR